MKSIINLLNIVLIIIFLGCTGNKPQRDDIIGTWIANDSASFQFNEDGTFVTRNLSGRIMFPMEDKYEKERFNETGTWEIEKWQGQWVVDLGFNRSGILTKGYATRILISGEGIYENRPLWYLFLWEGEEGGSRYKFARSTR